MVGQRGFVESSLSIELLEATHQFPGPYLFKAIGRVDDGFAARVVAAVRDEMNEGTDPPYSFRHSSGGAHVSVTMEPQMQTAAQVLAVYQRLRGVSGLVMLW